MHTPGHQRLPTVDDEDGQSPTRSYKLQPISKAPLTESSSHEPFLARYRETPCPKIELPYQKDIKTKFMCLVGLAASLVIGVGFVVLGGFAQDDMGISTASSQNPASGIRQFTLNQVLKELIPLAINIIITGLTESLGLIHATSLKWALYNEDRLEFNANLRLLSFTRKSWANSRVVNVIYLLALALCYASSPAILITLPNEACYMSKTKYTGPVLYTVSKSGPLCLGLSLLILCAICTWSLTTTKAPTWSTHPLTVLSAATSEGRLVRRIGRCMRSVHDKRSECSPIVPNAVQKSGYAAHKDVLKVLLVTGISLLLILVWFGGVQGTSSSGGCSWSILPPAINCGSANLPNEYAQAPCSPASILLDAFDSKRYDFDRAPTPDSPEFEFTRDSGIAAQILFTVLIQSFITAGLHCAELEVTLFRDEAMWRDMITPEGADTTKSSIVQFLRSWPSLTLLAMKPLIHWIYGLSMTITYNGLIMQAPQVLYLSIAWCVLLAFVLFVSVQKPKGPLPAAYGHLQTMANVVDDWSPLMYWGDKGSERGVAHAGTSSKPLPRVAFDKAYM